MIPSEKQIREKLLMELYASTKEHSAVPKDVYKQVADYFLDELEPIDFEKYRESESKWANSVQWTREHLVKEGIIFPPTEHKRNDWRLTDKGVKIARQLFIDYFGYDHWKKELDEETITDEIVEKFKPYNEDARFLEGKIKLELHYRKERNPKLVALKKKLAFDKNPLLPCEVCGISFKEMYGDIGEGFIEAHHNYPISELTEEIKTAVEDLVLLCSNCHTMIHRKRPWLTPTNLQSLLSD